MMRSRGTKTGAGRLGKIEPDLIHALKDVLREVVILSDSSEAVVDVLGVNRNCMAFQLRRVERYLIEQPFHDGVKAPRADILLLLVDREGYFGQPPDTVWLEIEGDALGGQ